MSKTKHSPGPWTGGRTASVWSGNNLVASVFPYDDSRLAELEANMALIAAAPDLLEQLRLVQEHFQAKGVVWTGIDKAIAKAEGRL